MKARFGLVATACALLTACADVPSAPSTTDVSQPTATPRSVTLTISVSPEGAGRVDVFPTPDSQGTYPAGTNLVLRAVPGSNSKFASWAGDIGGATNPASFRIDSDATVVAVFDSTESAAAQAQPSPRSATAIAPTPAPTPIPTEATPAPAATTAPSPTPGRAPTATVAPSPTPARVPTATVAPSPTPARAATATASPAPTRIPTVARPTPTTAAAPTQTPAVDVQESAGATVTVEYENQEDLQSLLASNDVTSDIVFWSVQVLLLDGSSVIVRTGHLYLETHEDVRFDSNLGSAHLIRAQTRDGITLWAVTEQITADTVLKIDLRSTYEAVLIYASSGSMTPDSASINDLKRKAAQALERDADVQVQALKRLVDGAILEKVDYSAVTVGSVLGPVRSLDDILASPEP